MADSESREHDKLADAQGVSGVLHEDRQMHHEGGDDVRSNDAPVYHMDSPASGKHGNETRTLNQLLAAGVLQPGSVLRVPMERGLSSIKGSVTANGEIHVEDGTVFHSPSSFVTHFKGYCTGLDMIKVDGSSKTLGVLHRDYRRKMGLGRGYPPPPEPKEADADKHGGITIEHGKDQHANDEQPKSADGSVEHQPQDTWAYAQSTADAAYAHDTSLGSPMQSPLAAMTHVPVNSNKRQRGREGDGEKQRYVTLRELFEAGLIKAGVTIEYQWRRSDGNKKAVVTEHGRLRVEDTGQEFQSLYEWKKTLGGTVQGLSFFKILDTGRYLSELKEEYLQRMLAQTGSIAPPRRRIKKNQPPIEEKEKVEEDKPLENPVTVQVRDCMQRLKSVEQKVGTLLDVVKKLTGHNMHDPPGQ